MIYLLHLRSERIWGRRKTWPVDIFAWKSHLLREPIRKIVNSRDQSCSSHREISGKISSPFNSRTMQRWQYASLYVGNIIQDCFDLKLAQATNRSFSTADWALPELEKSDKIPMIRFNRIPATEYLHILRDPIGVWPSDHTGSDNRILSDSPAESHRISADWVNFWSDSDNPFSTGFRYRNGSRLKRILPDPIPWFWPGYLIQESETTSVNQW